MDELERIKDAVEQLQLPDYVRDVKYKLRDDWTGEPAVSIFVILDDAEVEKESFGPNSIDIGNQIFDAVMALGTERWPFVRFRSESEENSLVSGNAHGLP